MIEMEMKNQSYNAFLMSPPIVARMVCKFPEKLKFYKVYY